jgi:hypothetical protein
MIKALALSNLLFACVVVVFYIHNITMAGMLSAYQKQCLDPEAAAYILDASRRILDVNEKCIENQRRLSRWPELLYKNIEDENGKIRSRPRGTHKGSPGVREADVRSVRTEWTRGIGGGGQEDLP